MQYCSAKQLKKLRNFASAFARGLRQRRYSRLTRLLVPLRDNAR